jgi:hypothetical protein
MARKPVRDWTRPRYVPPDEHEPYEPDRLEALRPPALPGKRELDRFLGHAQCDGACRG